MQPAIPAIAARPQKESTSPRSPIRIANVITAIITEAIRAMDMLKLS